MRTTREERQALVERTLSWARTEARYQTHVATDPCADCGAIIGGFHADSCDTYSRAAQALEHTLWHAAVFG